MAYEDRGSRPRRQTGSGGGSSRQRLRASQARVPAQGSYHGPRGTSSRGSAGRSGRGGGRGYALKPRSINFQSDRGRRNDNRRLLILLALAVVLVVLLVVGISSCVRSCGSDQDGSAETNALDSRVAAGVSEELTGEFTTALDRGEKLAQIAANASAYDDEGLLELALSEPDAIDFVAAYPEAEKTAQAYEDSVSQGTVPELYCWDSRWGNVDYAGRALALTGSGPTALAMAYMGLTGTADQTPATVAELVSEAGAAEGDSSMSAEFLTDSLSDLGLSCTSSTSNADNLTELLDAGTYVLLEASAGSLTDAAHWVVVVSENDDGSLVVYDPTSPEVSAHAWDAANLASSCNTLYGISLAEDEASE